MALRNVLNASYPQPTLPHRLYPSITTLSLLNFTLSPFLLQTTHVLLSSLHSLGLIRTGSHAESIHPIVTVINKALIIIPSLPFTDPVQVHRSTE